ncbi:hypothetical protein MRX96_014644 [Rhipicephalus microplus]
MASRPPLFEGAVGSWGTYRIRFEAFFEGHEVTDPGKRRALLVSSLSDSFVWNFWLLPRSHIELAVERHPVLTKVLADSVTGSFSGISRPIRNWACIYSIRCCRLRFIFSIPKFHALL